MPTDDDPLTFFRVTRDGGPGLTRRQTQSSRFTAPTRGLRVMHELGDDPATLAAGLCDLRPDAVLTDVTAASLWGLPLPPWLQQTNAPVSMAVASERSHTRRLVARGRRLELPADHVTTKHDLRITTPSRTWLDCAAEVPFAYVVAMGDAVLHRGLTDLTELGRLCHWAYRRRGVAVARRALPLLDAGAESPGESLVRVALLDGRLPRPLCNANVFLHGEWLARVDLLWPGERVIVEYDGLVHLPEAQRRRDAQRRNLLQEAGYYVIVLTADDLRRPEQMCNTVRVALHHARLR